MKENLHEKVKALEGEKKKREAYISGLERQMRTLKEENDRLRTEST